MCVSEKEIRTGYGFAGAKKQKKDRHNRHRIKIKQEREAGFHGRKYRYIFTDYNMHHIVGNFLSDGNILSSLNKIRVKIWQEREINGRRWF